MSSKTPATQKISKQGRQKKPRQTDLYGKRPECKVQYPNTADPMPGVMDTPVASTGTTASEKSTVQHPPRKYDPLPCLDDEPEGLRWVLKARFHASFRTNGPKAKLAGRISESQNKRSASRGMNAIIRAESQAARSILRMLLLRAKH